ncbi:MAG TPA: hypothetical protein VNE21_05880 [Mycobacteriales bacterium]|nr:hypothetical protein [Mycobacteriales bacterium]
MQAHRHRGQLFARLACGVGVAGALLTAVPSYAGSAFAGQVQTATGSINVSGSDGRTYQIGVTVQSATPLGGSPSNQLQITVASCVNGSCGSGLQYQVTLPANAVSFPSSTATGTQTVTVHTRVSGLPFTATWTTNSGTTPGAVLDVNNTFTLTANGATPGPLSLHLFGLSCSGPGQTRNTEEVVANGVTQLGGGVPPGRSPREFTTVNKHRPRCAPALSS